MTAPEPLMLLRALNVTALRPPTPVTGGADSLIWRVETSQGARALRVLRPEQAPVAAREARVMNWLADQGLPVPRARAYAEPDGRPALLLDWVEGEPLAAALFARPQEAAALGAAFAQVQARLHALEVPPDLLGRLPPVTVPGAPPPMRPALLHLDYHPLNVLVQGGAVAGVIDWSNVGVGDARADAARSLSILSADPTVWRFTGAQRAALLAFRRAYRAALPGRAPDAAHLTWAGEAMHADLSRRHSAQELRHVARWTAWWRARRT